MAPVVPGVLLLGGLSLATIPLALAPSVWPLAVLAFVAGLLCAPTITATVDQVSQVVPEAARGEAMGWHGSFMTAGIGARSARGRPGHRPLGLGRRLRQRRRCSALPSRSSEPRPHGRAGARRRAGQLADATQAADTGQVVDARQVVDAPPVDAG